MIGICNAKKHADATTIVETCPGYKLLLVNSWPLEAFIRCCEAVKADPECGNSWFRAPISGKCVCQKKGYNCIRNLGFEEEYRFESSEELTTPQPKTTLPGKGTCRYLCPLIQIFSKHNLHFYLY